MDASAEHRAGTLAGLAAYGLWGVFPLVFHALRDVGAVELLLHRIVWSVVAVGAVLAVRGRLGEIVDLATDARRRRLLIAAAAVISVNWLTYIWAVNHDRVLDAALGYYVNPLLSVAVGVGVLGEHLRPAQRVAVGLGAVAVVVLTVANGVVPWVSMVLAGSFATYGYLKKAAAAPAVPSLAFETAVLAPFAAAGLATIAVVDGLSFGNGTVGRDLGLVSLGVVTALPLVLFTAAATRIPLAQVGLLQYVAPTMQFLIGALVFHESLPAPRVAGFVLVWAALTVLAVDAFRSTRPVPVTSTAAD